MFFCVWRNRVIFHTYESKATVVRLQYLFRLHLCCLFHTFFPLLPKKRRLNNTIIHQQNNATPHKVNIVNVFMKDNTIQLLSLAAVSPGINFIESLRPPNSGNSWELWVLSVFCFFLVEEMKMKSSTGRQSDSKILENGPQILDFMSHIL